LLEKRGASDEMNVAGTLLDGGEHRREERLDTNCSEH
jgi:hypothetical protein